VLILANDGSLSLPSSSRRTDGRSKRATPAFSHPIPSHSVETAITGAIRRRVAGTDYRLSCARTRAWRRFSVRRENIRDAPPSRRQFIAAELTPSSTFWPRVSWCRTPCSNQSVR
jgi:hypothetical protein